MLKNHWVVELFLGRPFLGGFFCAPGGHKHLTYWGREIKFMETQIG